MSLLEDLWDGVTSIPGAVVGAFEDPVGTIEDIITGVVGAGSDVVSQVWSALSESPACLMFTGSPSFWQTVAEIRVAKKAGLVTTPGTCQKTREVVVEALPVLKIIPGLEYFWNCACKVALSDQVTDTAVAEATAVSVATFGLSAEDQVTGVISAVSWGKGRLDLLARDMDNGVLHKCHNPGGGWFPDGYQWSALGGQIQQPPVIVSWGKDRLDLFVCGSDRSLWHKCFRGADGWYPSARGWNSLGGQMLGGPAVVSWGPGILNVVVRGIDNSVYYKGFDDRGWTPWASLVGQTRAAPSLASWGPGRLDVFVRGLDNACHHRAYDASSFGWGPWENLGGNITGAPAAVAWGPNRLDLVVRGSNGSAWHKCWTPNGYYPAQTEWSNLGGNITDTPSIVSWAPGRLDMVARGADGAVWHKCFQEGEGWYPSETGWVSLGGQIEGSPTILSWDKGVLNIVARGTGAGIKPHLEVHKPGAKGKEVIYKGYSQKNGWYPSLTEWVSLGGNTK